MLTKKNLFFKVFKGFNLALLKALDCYLFDQFIRGKAVNFKIEIPDSLKGITQENHKSVKDKVSRFLTDSENNRSAELILTAHQINYLIHPLYVKFYSLSLEEKSDFDLYSYDIKDGLLIEEDILMFTVLSFLFKKPYVYNKRIITIVLEQGSIREVENYFMLYNQDLGRWPDTPRIPILMGLILSSPYEKSYKDMNQAERAAFQEIFSRLKSIEVSNETLILRA